ncbi:hypothetical protein GPB2148_3193 [marine gamma proteobacterium HTCC2148]|nr:hypothetical protein GPB2148_3193 [marine gamma proteobacterium HTCC2148]
MFSTEPQFAPYLLAGVFCFFISPIGIHNRVKNRLYNIKIINYRNEDFGSSEVFPSSFSQSRMM